MGYEEYFPLAKKYHVPIVVTGFEPLDILQGILMTVQQLESGRAEVENQYARAVRREGNQPAQELIKKVFTGRSAQVARHRRNSAKRPGLGAAYAAFDAAKKFGLTDHRVEEPAECIAGLILQGLKKPHECSGVRHALHAGASVRRDDGFERRRVRGVLSLPAAN